jgi:hypothetical protein
LFHVLPRLSALIVCVLCLAGCNGGTVDRHALTNDSATIDSIACEGALLAHDVSLGRTTANFTGEQAERRVRAKADDAARLASTIARLRDDPSNKQLAAAVATRLARLGGCR